MKNMEKHSTMERCHTVAIKKAELQTSGGKLQYHISGSGELPIVLINGGSGPIEGWMNILPAITQSAPVFAYNRLGVAGSGKPKEPQDGRTIVETLREALQVAGFKPPYLLVGHSLGGLYANLFARMYPREAAGVVFLEASHPKDLILNEYQGKGVKTLNKLLAMFDFLSPHKKFDEVHFVQRTAEQIGAIDRFPDIPVYVVTGGKENRMTPEPVRRMRLEHQMELLALSNISKHMMALQSGHFPQFTEPQLVIDAIKQCAGQARQTKV